MKKKRLKKTADPKDYEGFSYGPLKFERVGRFMRMSSNWAPGEFEKHIESVKANRPTLKTEIDQKIKGVIEIVEKYNPLDLLAIISIENCFCDPEEYKEITHKGRESYMEYALSLALAFENNTIRPHPDKKNIENFNSLISEIFDAVMWYFGSEVAEGQRTRTEEEIRYQEILRFLFLRGDSFSEHHTDLMKDLFTPHDKFLNDNYGITTNQILIAIKNIEEQLIGNIKHNVVFLDKVTELHNIFKEFVDKKGLDSFSSLEDCKSQYNALPEVKIKAAELAEISTGLNENIFEIQPNEKTPIGFIKLISANFGENSDFISFKETLAWPSNNTIIHEKPLITKDGKYYCFVPQLLSRSLRTIIEALVKNKNSVYFVTTYKKRTASYLENKSLEYFSRLLPGATIFGKMFYSISENGEIKRVETDGIILYDDNLFIIENKSGALTIPARRGGLERIKKDVSDLISSAYKQALRTKEYIVNAPKPKFEYENGAEALVIEDKNKFNNVYVINITLDNLAQLSIQLNSLKTLNLIDGKEWPWSVFINDLRVISELIEFPSVFLLYLQRRIRVNDYPQLHFFDELDFLMFYLREGLYFEDGKLKDTNMFTVTGYTEDLDRYYSYIAGIVSTGEKPKLRVSEEFKSLLKNIEKTQKFQFTKITTTLLSFDEETRQAILKGITTAKSNTLQDKMDHDATMYFEELSLGILISIGVKRSINFSDKMDRHCNLKMYQMRFLEWFLITIDVQGDGSELFDFKIYKKKWEYDPIMETQLERYRKWKIAEALKSRKEIGRNDICPCNSGLKYKKCCGK